MNDEVDVKGYYKGKEWDDLSKEETEELIELLRGKVNKATVSYDYNRISTVVHDEEANELLDRERIVPASGTFGNVRIYRQFPDGSTSETKWDGNIVVKAGDMVLLDGVTGQLRIKKPVAAENLPSSIWAEAWAKLYNCFGERLQQDELDLMDSVLQSVEADAQEEIKMREEANA